MSDPCIRFSHLGNLAEPPVISEIMKVALEEPQILSLAAGFTDTHGLPVQSVRDAGVYLATSGKVPEYLQYGTTRGRPELRTLVAKRLSRHDRYQSPAYHPDHVLLTNGSQQALYLAVQVLCDPGDIFLVENPSYFVFLELLKGLGVTALGIPLNEKDEIDSVGFESLIERLKEQGALDRVKGIYLESWFSNPSTRCLPNTQKIEIARILKKQELIVPVLEDGAYFELFFEEPYPSTSIFALREFDAFPRLFFGTFTKPFATGLKLGYAICDHAALLQKMANIKGHHDFGSSNYSQAIMEQVIQDGSYDKQLEKCRLVYRDKMQGLDKVLTEERLPELGWRWHKPTGGMFLWLNGPVKTDTSITSGLFEKCVKDGVLYVPGDLCFAPGVPKNYIRLSFGVLDYSDLQEAGKRLAGVLHMFCK